MPLGGKSLNIVVWYFQAILEEKEPQVEVEEEEVEVEVGDREPQVQWT